VAHSKSLAPNDISRLVEPRVVKFCTKVDYIISQLKDVQTTTKGTWSVSCDPFFSFDAHNHISGMAEATVAKFCMQVEYTKCLTFDDRIPLMGQGQGHVTRFLNFALFISYLWNW